MGWEEIYASYRRPAVMNKGYRSAYFRVCPEVEVVHS